MTSQPAHPAADPAPGLWRCGRFALSLARPLVMGVVNATPDSFSDAGRSATPRTALDLARRLIDDGADLIDLGGESTRPGAPEVSAEEELRRVLPVLEALADCGVPVSVDTAKPTVMRAALAAGAAVINDVTALQGSGAVEAVRASGCGLVLMHMQGTPRTMQIEPRYGDVVTEVAAWLGGRRQAAIDAGIEAGRIALDPGFGFGKTVAHNLELLGRLDALGALGAPVLAGLSRKSMLGAVTGRPVDQRLHASVAAALLAVERGARIVRVHDVAATVDALKLWCAVAAIDWRRPG